MLQESGLDLSIQNTRLFPPPDPVSEPDSEEETCNLSMLQESVLDRYQNTNLFPPPDPVSETDREEETYKFTTLPGPKLNRPYENTNLFPPPDPVFAADLDEEQRNFAQMEE